MGLFLSSGRRKRAGIAAMDDCCCFEKTDAHEMAPRDVDSQTAQEKDGMVLLNGSPAVAEGGFVKAAVQRAVSDAAVDFAAKASADHPADVSCCFRC